MQSIAELIRPRLINISPMENHTARIVIEPLERGFGHTLGNALRHGWKQTPSCKRHCPTGIRGC